MIRLVHFLQRRRDVDPDRFATYLRNIHGPLVASVQTDLDIVRYVQLHPDSSDDRIGEKAAEARGGMQPPFDAVAEYWWHSERALCAALASSGGRAASQRLLASEQTIADLDLSPLWFADEYPQIASGPRRPVAYVKSGLMRLHFALRQPDGMTAEDAKRYWLSMHGPLVRSHAPARGVLAYNQVHRIDAPSGLDGPWPHSAARCDFFGHAESWFERPGLERPPEMAAAMAAAIADERAFIDWRRSTMLVGKELVFVDREWT